MAWELNEFLAAVEREFSRPAVWGESDCCIAPCNVLRDHLGVDPAADFRGKYTDKESAYRIMGPGGVMATVARRSAELGWSEVDPVNSEVGDIGVRGRSMAIYAGAWIAKGEAGMFILDRVTRAWRPICD